jgi:glycosyltransferase involved in cell wall biosynthesis
MLFSPIHFSCIITCYNREKEITRSIQSILNQTFPYYEIIVVDDASKDNSIAAVESIDDPRIQVIKNERNSGQNFSLNAGIKASKYNYLAFLDSDDTWNPNYLMEMAKVYLEFPKIGFAYANLVNGPIWELEGSDRYADVLNQGYLSSMITITAKKSAVNKVGNFDLNYTICQDDDFCFRLAKQFSFKVIKQQLSLIHGAENSMTRNRRNVARGWAFLFHNYEADILSFCGTKTFAKHMLMVSKLYFISNSFLNGFKYYLLALKFLITPTHHKYQFSFKSFWRESVDIIKLMTSKINWL